MSCADCEEIQKNGSVAYFRWGKANIGVIGCNKHLNEIFTILCKNTHLADKLTIDKHPVYRVLKE